MRYVIPYQPRDVGDTHIFLVPSQDLLNLNLLLLRGQVDVTSDGDVIFLPKGSRAKRAALPIHMLVELKTGTGTALQQLENSECFWNFIQKSAERNGVDVSNIERTIKVKLHQPQKAGTKIEVPRYDTKTKCVIYHWSSCRLNRILQLAH